MIAYPTISNWTNCWQLKLNIVKCEALAITNKRKPVNFTYYINDQSILWNNPVKYLGVLVDGKLSWSKHCRYAIKKATKSLNCLRRSMFGCSCVAKCAAYKAVVCPTLEYAAVVWSPHTKGDIKLLESLQNRAAGWICGVHGPIHGLYLQVIAALSLISLPLNQDVSTFLFLSSIIFITNVHPSSLIVTVNLIQFHLLEVITCQ